MSEPLLNSTRRWRPAACVAVAFLVLAADYLTGPHIHFPALYLFPVALAAWSGNPRTGFTLAVGMPLVRLAFAVLWGEPWHPVEEGVNTVVDAAVLGSFAWLVGVVAAQRRALEAEVQTLQGLLPICSFCKKIRDPRGEWQPLERFIGERSQAEFTHGVCPECLREHYGPYLRGGPMGPSPPGARSSLE